MGKKIALLVLFAGFGVALYAQNTILIRAGYNQSFFYETGEIDDFVIIQEDVGSKPAYYFGFSFYKEKGRIIHMEPAFNFTARHVSMDYREKHGVLA